LVGLFPWINAKTCRCRDHAVWHSVWLVADRGEEKIVQIRMEERKSHAEAIGCHTFRATGITTYLANGGALEHAQEKAAHESPRTTKLYDRTKDRLTRTRSSGSGCSRHPLF
jgi:integrase